MVESLAYCLCKSWSGEGLVGADDCPCDGGIGGVVVGRCGESVACCLGCMFVGKGL